MCIQCKKSDPDSTYKHFERKRLLVSLSSHHPGLFLPLRYEATSSPATKEPHEGLARDCLEAQVRPQVIDMFAQLYVFAKDHAQDPLVGRL